MINLETPRKFQQLVDQAHMVAIEVFRKNSRKYDLAEHEYPKELDMLAAVIEGSNPAGAGAGAVGSGPKDNGGSPSKTAITRVSASVSAGLPARAFTATPGMSAAV